MAALRMPGSLSKSRSAMIWRLRKHLNQVLLRKFDETAIFRIDHYLGKRPVNSMVVFRFTNAFMEAFWNRNYIESMQITMAEDFGVQGRGAFYDQTGTIRDVVQNHLFQVMCNLAMEAPVRLDSESIRDEKVKVLKAIPALDEKSIIRGQFRGYLDEKGVAPDSKVETFAALRLEVNSWRWQGVPFYIRAGKSLPVTCTEIVCRLRKPPSVIPADALTSNYFRFRVSPDVGVAMGMTVIDPGEKLVGKSAEMIASQHTQRRGNGCVRTRAGRCNDWRRYPVCTGRLCGRSLANRRSVTEKCYADLCLRAKNLGTE